MTERCVVRRPIDPRPQLPQLVVETLVAAVEVVDLLDDRVAIGRQPGKNQCGTGAKIAGGNPRPLRRSTPVTVAVPWPTTIAAPSRFNSAACRNRLGNTRSSMRLMPSLTDASAVHWACRSVGMPGYGSATTSTARSRRSAEIDTQSGPTSIFAPASSSLVNTASRCTGLTPTTVAEPRVMAAAITSVAASMRSGISRCDAPPSCWTPSIRITDVPSPSIRAPIATRKRPRSTISGSTAAPRIVVVPRASTAALITLAVPVTVGPHGPERSMLAPVNRRAEATT